MTASLEFADQVLEGARADIDAVLHRWAAGTTPPVAYSLTGPGKRLRGTLTIECYHAAGGTSHEIAELAAVVEVVHAYSLVHDDLPCMDDDDLRRGRPTTHRAFDVVQATRAGFAMVPLAAQVLAEATRRLNLDDHAAREIAVTVFRAAGAGGMIGGQFLDLEAEGHDVSLAALEALHRAKTGALVTASCAIGAIAARAPASVREGLRRFGREVGLAFQIADDVLDATQDAQTLGKNPSDAALDKSTYVALYGLDEAKTHARAQVDEAVRALRAAEIESPALEALAGYVIDRGN